MPSPGHNGSGLGQPEFHDRDNGRSGPRSALIGDGSIYHQPSGGFRRQARNNPAYPELALNDEHAHDRYMAMAERARSYIDAESYVAFYPEEPALANPRLEDQRERRRLHEPAWIDNSRRHQYVNVANEPTRLSHAAPFEARGDPSVPVAFPHRQNHYINPTCPCGIPNCSAKAIRKKYFERHPEGRKQAVRATLDFSFDKIGFMVMDGTSATWIGQPGDDTPPPLSDKPMPRRAAERKSRWLTPTQLEPHATRKVTSADKAASDRARAIREQLAGLPRLYHYDPFPRESVEADSKSKPFKGSKKSGSSKKPSSSSKASRSSTNSSSSYKGSYSSRRSNTLVAGAETDIDEDSSLGINLFLKD